ncbi:MAG: hypothetical protein IT423_22270 [Pirellulaceae bacterium]|nr:hypothetical protein [Pirellulaceae bacterium]
MRTVVLVVLFTGAVSSIALPAAWLPAQDRQVVEARVDIPFVPESASHPLLVLNRPPAGSLDKLELTTNGLLIKQVEAGGSKAKTTGFTLNVQAPSAFALMLDYDIKQLEAPKAARVQGMWIRFVLEGGEIPALGVVSGPKMKRGLATTARHSDTVKLAMQLEPTTFTSGTWIIERQGNELRLSIGEATGSYRIVKRMPCPEQPLKEIQVWCTRYNFGNGPAEFLFKSARFIDASQVVGQAVRVPWLSAATWSRLFYVGCLLSACGFVGWYFYKLKKGP